MRSIGRILIANRGEIAVRIIATCRRLGISPVAVCSEADKRAPHARLADEAVILGPAPAGESYLRIDRILEAARRTGADAIHPGYGFLAENAQFAAAFEEAGIVFIGPPAEAIRRAGYKSSARRLAAEAGVATVPGYDGNDQSAPALRRAAREIGWPVLIKAAAGGGGRGMRIVADEAALEEALESARREADKAFGDGSLLLERFLARARHVEFQIFGDAHGDVVHLFERECSVQRRHQKIIEESPSPALDEQLRARMGEAAVRVAKAAGYRNAGTVEFLLATSGEFYFLEMNTRLQVEHPVTELVTGLDLVEMQIAIARGEPLPPRLLHPIRTGHAIEARLYAEDPANDFLPATGTVRLWRPPAGVRVDTGIDEGAEIGIYYDPLLAKLISYAPDREGARRRLLQAVQRLVVEGVATNREYLAQILDSDEFCRGATHIGLVEERPYARRVDPDEDFLYAAALVLHLDRGWPRQRKILPGVPSGYRNSPWREASMVLRVGGEDLKVEWRRLGPDRYRLRAVGRTMDAEILEWRASGITAAFDGMVRAFEMMRDAETFFLCSALGSRTIERRPRLPMAQVAAQREAAHSPMPGQVLRILVEPGRPVRAGDPLVVLEAMKMEQTIRTTIDGLVEAVLVQPGEVVAPGQTLVRIATHADELPKQEA